MIMIVTVSDANPPWSWGSIVMAFAIYPPIGLFRLPLMCGSALFMLKTCNTKPKFANVAIMTLSPGYIFAVYTMPIVFGVRFSKLKYNLGMGTDITDAFINRSCFFIFICFVLLDPAASITIAIILIEDEAVDFYLELLYIQTSSLDKVCFSV